MLLGIGGVGVINTPIEILSFQWEYLFEWCHQESNRGHKDFQSFALPTELWHHVYLFCDCKGSETFGLCNSFHNKKR